MADKEVIDNFLSTMTESQIGDYGLKVHEECCGKPQPMYLGFSRFSLYMQETVNPYYQKEKEVSASNQMFIPAENSIARQFSLALKALQN